MIRGIRSLCGIGTNLHQHTIPFDFNRMALHACINRGFLLIYIVCLCQCLRKQRLSSDLYSLSLHACINRDFSDLYSMSLNACINRGFRLIYLVSLYMLA